MFGTKTLDWDEANTAHIALHDEIPSEAEDVIANLPVTLKQEIRDGETCRSELGETDTGHVMVVFSTDRFDKKRVIAAHGFA